MTTTQESTEAATDRVPLDRLVRCYSVGDRVRFQIWTGTITGFAGAGKAQVEWDDGSESTIDFLRHPLDVLLDQKCEGCGNAADGEDLLGVPLCRRCASSASPNAQDQP